MHPAHMCFVFHPPQPSVSSAVLVTYTPPVHVVHVPVDVCVCVRVCVLASVFMCVCLWVCVLCPALSLHKVCLYFRYMGPPGDVAL